MRCSVARQALPDLHTRLRESLSRVARVSIPPTSHHTHRPRCTSRPAFAFLVIAFVRARLSTSFLVSPLGNPFQVDPRRHSSVVGSCAAHTRCQRVPMSCVACVERSVDSYWLRLRGFGRDNSALTHQPSLFDSFLSCAQSYFHL